MSIMIAVIEVNRGTFVSVNVARPASAGEIRPIPAAWRAGGRTGDLTGMAKTEWWQRGPVDGVPAVLQPVAHILLQVRESVDDLVVGLTETDWNARPANIASAAFHVRHMTGVIDRLFTYARGDALSEHQFAALRAEGAPLAMADVPSVLEALHTRVEVAVAELRAVDVATLGDFRPIGRSRLPSTVIGCLVHGAEHAMRHVGQLSVTVRVVRVAASPGPG
jgi:hypothetical protein